MTLGQFARKVLGARGFRFVGSCYRSFFLNVPVLVKTLSKELPEGVHAVDVGGGDGLILNLLSRQRPDLRFTMIDVSPSLGGFVDADIRERVEIKPRTSIRQFIGENERPIGAIIVSDVLHHVPVSDREGFISDLYDLSGAHAVVIIKDIAPSGIRARLSVLSDVYVTGDTHVSLADPEEVIRLLRTAFGNAPTIEQTSLLAEDFPNYAIIVRP